ncbi:UvrD-helicase domain-containing protein [Alienimonas chondri]|uniref:DNA 3'-5' helicase n=1 Tax=Alienimonas chondri TaxID=2681879 RepID=A0ABX1VG01_9PLAN|nr:UvrD-helicase domain-containing protein [Alienimonas chondri]NNJ27054.1 ATP-dependent helicase/nuclease subunit A [Alienimonas chondri]
MSDRSATPSPVETTGPTLHAQQSDAVGHRISSVGLSAGAGCGKTTVLIERFLQELEPADENDGRPQGLPAVVAITFTEKATAEMVSRVRRSVGERLRDPARASQRKHWRTVQRRLDTARISTIHGFCTTLLKENAAAADLDPAFRTVEATEEADLRADAVDAALKTALARSPEKHADEGALSPRDLVTRCGLTTVRTTLLNLLDTDRKLLDREWTTETLVAARAGAWERELIAPLFEALRDSSHWAELQPVLTRNLHTKPDKADARRTLLTECELLFTGPPPDANGLRSRLAAVRPLMVAGKLGQSPKMWDGEDYAVIQAHLASFRGLADELLKTLGDGPPDFAAALPAVRAYVPLAADAARRYERVKRETARLDFGDQLRLAARLLRDDAVREKVSRSIRLLMVDEFQDTSPVQAELVRRIAGLAAGEDAGKLFLVGDAKQSIYRFTGADPQVFGRIRGEIAPAGRLPLTKNFRSRPEILRFVNALFAPSMEDYEPLEPPPGGALESSSDPQIEFLLPTVPLGPGGAKPKAAECREVEAKWVAARVRELLDGDACVRVICEPDRVPVPGDVCLLFRALTDVKLYEDALREVGVDAYIAGGKSFFAQQEVQDLVHLLLWLDDPDDTLSLAGVLRSPLCGLSDDTLFTLCDRPAEPEAGAADRVDEQVRFAPLAAAVLEDASFPLPAEQNERLSHVRGVLRGLIAGRSRFGPGGLLQRAVEGTGYDGALLLEFLGERKLANLRKLLRMARDADALPDGGLRGFAARLLESVKETLSEGEAATVTQDPNVVTLMTVHGSKGLEFPIVVACDLDRKPPGVSVEGTFDPDLGPIVPLSHQHGEKLEDPGAEIWKAREKAADEAEIVRIFYVAATRAADRLILSAARPVDEKAEGTVVPKRPTGIPLKTLEAVFDLKTGKPHAPTVKGPLYEPPEIRTHEVKPAGVGKALPGSRRGTPPGKFASVLADTEPCEPYDLRRPLPPVRSRLLHVAELTERIATDAERDELAAFLEPDSDAAAEARKRLREAVRAPGNAAERRDVDFFLPSSGPGRPGIDGRMERLYRLDDGWLSAGVATATAAEVAAERLPDRLAPRLWAEREALRWLGGGQAALVLVAADGSSRVVRTDDLPASEVSAERLETLLKRIEP